MFQGFPKGSQRFFLGDKCFNNEREWFHAHKEQYDTLIGTPMKELAKETYELLLQRFPAMEARVHVSRIWRGCPQALRPGGR